MGKKSIVRSLTIASIVGTFRSDTFAVRSTRDLPPLRCRVWVMRFREQDKAVARLAI